MKMGGRKEFSDMRPRSRKRLLREEIVNINHCGTYSGNLSLKVKDSQRQKSVLKERSCNSNELESSFTSLETNPSNCGMSISFNNSEFSTHAGHSTELPSNVEIEQMPCESMEWDGETSNDMVNENTGTARNDLMVTDNFNAAPSMSGCTNADCTDETLCGEEGATLSDYDSLSDGEDTCEQRCFFNGSEEDGMSSGYESDIFLEELQVPAKTKETAGFCLQIFLSLLAAWALKNSITRDAVDALLKILRMVPGLQILPKSAKTLLPQIRKVSSFIQILEDGGQYFHFGLEKCLVQLLSISRLIPDEVRLLIFIDGLAVFESSPSELWPILATIQNVPLLINVVMPIGFYYAPHKPKNADFLEPLVNEILHLMEHKLSILGKKVSVSVQGFCMDAPAKSLCLGITGHTGYHSCTRCKIKGTYSHGRTHFNKIRNRCRTNDEFLGRVHKNYQKFGTPLTKIPGIHFVRSFCLDTMHLVYLGITKTLMRILFVGKKAHKGHKLSVKIKNIFSEKLVALKSWMPVEFQRKPRSLNECLRYKATELRTFLLYTGPLILKSPYLPERKYLNFMLLHVAMRILIQPKILDDVEMVLYAEKLLDCFIRSVESEYGKQYVTHNFHGLLHIVDDLYFFGSLQDCSAFKFENYMGFLKSLVKKKNKVLEQLAKRLLERYENHSLFPEVNVSDNKPQFFRRKKAPLEANEYEKMYDEAVTIKTVKPDNCVQLKDGGILLVSNIYRDERNNKHHFSGHRFLRKEDFFQSPCKSSLLNIFRVSEVSELKEDFFYHEVIHKCVLLPEDNGFVSYPLLHSKKE